MFMIYIGYNIGRPVYGLFMIYIEIGYTMDELLVIPIT